MAPSHASRYSLALGSTRRRHAYVTEPHPDVSQVKVGMDLHLPAGRVGTVHRARAFPGV